MNLDKNQEFVVLGHKIRLKDDAGEEVNVREIVNYVNKEIQDIQATGANLDNARLGVLVALKIAADKLKLENEYRGKVKEMQTFASDALSLIDEVYPASP